MKNGLTESYDLRRMMEAMPKAVAILGGCVLLIAAVGWLLI